MVAASGPGKALWHPMATVQKLDPRKNKLSKKAFPRDPGAPGRGRSGRRTRSTPPLPLPVTAGGRPGIRLDVDCLTFGMTLSNMGTSQSMASLPPPPPPAAPFGNMRNIGKPPPSFNPPPSRPSACACVRASDKSWGRGRWVRHSRSLPPSRRPSRIEPGIVRATNSSPEPTCHTHRRVPPNTFHMMARALSCALMNAASHFHT